MCPAKCPEDGLAACDRVVGLGDAVYMKVGREKVRRS